MIKKPLIEIIEAAEYSTEKCEEEQNESDVPNFISKPILSDIIKDVPISEEEQREEREIPSNLISTDKTNNYTKLDTNENKNENNDYIKEYKKVTDDDTETGMFTISTYGIICVKNNGKLL